LTRLSARQARALPFACVKTRLAEWASGPDGADAWGFKGADDEKEGRPMSRTKQRRKPTERSRRGTPAIRDARIMEEIKNRRYLAFVRAIVNGAYARGAR